MNQNNLFLFLILLLIILLTNCQKKENTIAEGFSNDQSGEYLTWSIKMADSEIARRGNSLMYGGSDTKEKWRYTTGLFLKSLLELREVTGKARYFEYAKKVIDSFVEENGDIKTYKMEDYNLDKINSGKVLLKLYQITSEERYKQAANLLREQLKYQPRTSEGGFWHKKHYPWQMWLDGIYMSNPFYAEYGSLFGEHEIFDDVLKQIKMLDTHTRDPQTGLRYHAWDESNKQAWANPVTGCSPHFWGRAMGWYSMALVDVLDYIPDTYENRKQIIFILTDLLKAIKDYQDDSGLWYQIIDMGDRPGNYLESSCSAMFVYTIAKSLNKSYIDESYRSVAIAAYNGLINKKISMEPDDGAISLNGICEVAGLGGDPYRDGSYQYYISEPVVSNDLKGVGPFIMAGIQMNNLDGHGSE